MIDRLESIFIHILMSPIYFIVFIKKIIKRFMDKNHRFVKIIFLYYLISFLLFVFGPIEYPINNLSMVVIYLSGYLLCFIIGYIFSVKTFKKDFNTQEKSPKVVSNSFYFDCGLFIALIISFATLVNIVGTNGISGIFDTVILGLSNPDVVYLNNLENGIESGIVTKMATLFSPITYIIIPIGMYFFKELKLNRKVLFVVLICLEIMSFLAKGTNFGIFKITIILLTIYYLKSKNFSKEMRKKLKKISIILGTFTIFYFFFTISSRMNYSEIPSTIFYLPINDDSFIFKLLPLSLSLPLLTGISYASQGVYGFSLAFNYNFTSTLGFGSGRFLLSIPDRLFNIDLWQNTYQYKMNDVWNSRVNWHTAFTWFANDVGFFGVLIIMLILGLLFGRILMEAIYQNNIIAISLLPLYVILLIFLPLNNIIFDNPLTAVPFISLTILWIALKMFKRS